MTKKIRIIILIICVACFSIVAPLLVLYSMGNRFDFKEWKITSTGGIYVRTFPTAGQIIIDSKISEKPGMFSNSVFVQSLLPDNHTVLVKKTGYYDYFKTVPVQKEQVTKLENILLIKEAVAFSEIAGEIAYFSVAPNNQNIITQSATAKNITLNYFSLNNVGQPKTFSIVQSGKLADLKWSDDSSRALIKIQSQNNLFYYFFDSTTQKPEAIRLSYLDKNSQFVSFSPRDPATLLYINNNTLYSAKGNSALPIITNIISFETAGTGITWLSSKGVLSSSDLSGKLINKLSLENFPVNAKKAYELISLSSNTFLKEDDALFKFDQSAKVFEVFSVPEISNYKILPSPDNKNLIFWSQKEIYLYSLADKKFSALFSGNQVLSLQWLNNYYITFVESDKIMISETDYRGNVNIVTLPQTISSHAFFNPQDNRLYVLSSNALMLSEKIIP